MTPFDSIYSHGFVRLAAAVPPVRLGDAELNCAATLDLARRAHAEHVALVVFPELGLVGYSNQDLFHQEALVDAALTGLANLREESKALTPILVVGLPMLIGHQLFNVAAVVHRGRVLGVVPKSYLPNYREFYEKRHFSAARQAVVGSCTVFGESVPFGTDLLFETTDVPGFVSAVEVCEDVWVPIPPSTLATMAGATVVVNPSGSNITIGKAGYRRQLCSGQSARTISAYCYAGSGFGESTTDLAWDGHALIAENGNILAESERFDRDPSFISADVDLDRLVADRIRMTSYVDCMEDYRDRLQHRRVDFELGVPEDPAPLRRTVARFPFVPGDERERAERCAEVYSIQRLGLATRLAATGIEHVVIGVSGGIDSTQALLVAVGSMDDLGLSRTNVLAYTMPGFATSAKTLRNAHRLMKALGVTAREIDIRPAAQRMLEDIDHPAARGECVYDVTYENVQAGARTSLLFRLANEHDALVVGTGDLSELALGWCTYGVGDQMSHYSLNASVPKTLIQYLVRWVAETEEDAPETRAVLEDILTTEVSPELIPDAGGGDEPHQRSEDAVGPYALADFFLYHVLRFGYRPSKVAFLARHAWRDDPAGHDLATICRWLREFLRRFFETSQFKRSALPDGPKVGSGGSLSPRGDWRAPSDASARLWLDELDRLMATLSREGSAPADRSRFRAADGGN